MDDRSKCERVTVGADGVVEYDVCDNFCFEAGGASCLILEFAKKYAAYGMLKVY